MGKRNVFYDDNGKELSVYTQQDGSLYIEIKDVSNISNNAMVGSMSFIVLSKTDAVLLILDLYRMKRLMINEEPR